ncbi:MAG TPA: hypothetical protein VIT38_03805 [Allosphingosinicella sp.]
MRAILPLALLLLGACGSGDVVVEDKVTVNQIERLSAPKEETVDVTPAVRLQPLRRADLGGKDPAGPGCAFGRDGRMLVAAYGGDAVARIDGRLLHLVHSSPVNETGGFFEDRQISISVGRQDVAAGVEPPPGAAGRWPARLTVTNRRGHAQRDLDGVWRCAR